MEDLLGFFLVLCKDKDPDALSSWALNILLMGWQQCPVRRLHRTSHTIMFPSLEPVAKTTGQERDRHQLTTIIMVCVTTDRHCLLPV